MALAGRPLEQPARPFSPPPAVVIPPQKYRPPRPPQRRHSGRIGFLIALALIVSLTALAVLFNGGLAPRSADPVPSGSDPGYSSWEQEEDLSAPPSIPQAETGTGVILSITPPSGEALTYTQVYEKAAPSIAALTAYSAGMVSTGTGIVLTADGYIVTNAHIIAGARTGQRHPLRRLALVRPVGGLRAFGGSGGAEDRRLRPHPRPIWR